MHTDTDTRIQTWMQSSINPG